MYALLAWAGCRCSPSWVRGGKGLPLANTTWPLVTATASAKVHSDCMEMNSVRHMHIDG